MRLALVLGIAALVFGSAASAGAAGNPDVELALVVQPHTPHGCGGTYSDCSTMQYRLAETGSYDVLVVAYNYDGLRAVRYALDYSGVADATFGSFNSCTYTQISGARAAGLFGVSQAWSACQAPAAPGEGVVIGWLELWGGAGRIDIVPDTGTSSVQAIDCSFAMDAVFNVHPAFVGGAAAADGDTSPCGQILANEETTWGGVKTLYR